MTSIPPLRPAPVQTPLVPPAHHAPTELALANDLQQTNAVLVRQRWEAAEFLGFETRNKYDIVNAQGRIIAHAAEDQKGMLGFLMRQFLGHWRRFDIVLYDAQRRLTAVGSHPFRFIFHRLEVRDANGRFLGALEQRWAWFSKEFDVTDAQGRYVMRMSSPLWRPWTFPFTRGSTEVAKVTKKWAGIFAEAFSDKEQFAVQFQDARLTAQERLLLTFCAIFVDLMYFEHKAN
jgi:uncharacterized protein YxjI